MRQISSADEIFPIYRVIIGETMRWISPGSTLSRCSSVVCETFVTDSRELTISNSGKIENSR